MREREGGETQLEKKRKVQETHFLVYMNVFYGQVLHSSCSCFENEHTRQQKYTTMPKNLDFMVIRIPTENHRDKHCLK